MSLIKDLVRPLVPEQIRRKVREGRVNREIEIWKELDLQRELDGLRVRVVSKADWTVFNEIFVEGIYDSIILSALNRCPSDKCVNVLDLGANVGFFTLRFVQQVFRSHVPDRPFAINCVEGSPRVYADLCARLAENARLKGHVRTHHGLVGRRSGDAEMYESSFGAGNSTVPQHWSKPTKVSFIDLDTLIPDKIEIDLLKCDIEGSEQDFQNTYPDLLARTKLAVVEVHNAYIDDRRFNDGMRQRGFQFHEVLWSSEKEKASLVAYSRERPLS
ncbi:FkbM family methyltransferase [Bradyrhizobium japonicum]|uniref:FkbM family methyltransferase n=1 Tax=Bradyrhizobium japonicum TaxID=375 RepID=UPI000462907A|nr:FkbM family methyltransferase [Bradyrhizobium japonicum]